MVGVEGRGRILQMVGAFAFEIQRLFRYIPMDVGIGRGKGHDHRTGPRVIRPKGELYREAGIENLPSFRFSITNKLRKLGCVVPFKLGNEFSKANQ